MPEISFFRTLFQNQQVHGWQTLTKSAWRHFYPNFLLIQDKLGQKTSLLLRSEILGLFGKTLTVDHMYSGHNQDKFSQQIQTPLSPELKKFCRIFFLILEATENLAHFGKQDQLHSLNILEVIDSEKGGYLNARNFLSQKTYPESTCSRVANTDRICAVTLYHKFSLIQEILSQKTTVSLI